MEQVTEAWHTGDEVKSKALLAEVLKLLGNNGYGRLIEALERLTCVIFTKDEKVMDRALKSTYFNDLEQLGQAYEMESRKAGITINCPLQIGSLCISWQSREQLRYITTSLICRLIAATLS